MYQDKFEYKRVKQEIVGAYPLEEVVEAHKSEVRGEGNSFRGPSSMDLGPREGSALHAPQMNGSGGHLITREPSVPHFPTGSTTPVGGKKIPIVTRQVLSSQPQKFRPSDFQKWVKKFMDPGIHTNIWPTSSKFLGPSK